MPYASKRSQTPKGMYGMYDSIYMTTTGTENRSVVSRDMREELDKKGHKEISCGDA